ncbi:MAG: hypothetical protein DRP66_08935 [Planctomycetota bacterium]|nr:MAG: hypothetical protein DRP66_08935 [Planctomycetota bacterium]
MAIAQMTKVMIASHRSEAARVLEALQQAGIVQVLDAERAMVSKDWPELHVEARRPKDLEDMVLRLDKAIVFLKAYAGDEAGVSMFSPLVVVDKKKYSAVVDGKEALELLEKTEVVESDIERLSTERENVSGRLDGLLPWKAVQTPVEEMRQLRTANCFTGLLPHQHFDEITAELAELGAAVEPVGGSGNMHACIIACMADAAGDVQKILRSGDFEAVSFEGMTGTVGELIADCREKLVEIEKGLEDARKKAAEIAKKRLSLQILYDHYQNLLGREATRANAPATESVVLLEGWVKTKDFKRLEKLVSGFGASSVDKMDIAEGEEPPVEIENSKTIRPFELVTRLYGMPDPIDVDPTAFLAPFFAIFFGLCLTDAGYGLVMIAVFWYLAKKMQGDKKLMWMLVICSVLTVIAGALTGSWFGNAIQEFAPWLEPVRLRILKLGFDPLEEPMKFFGLSLGLGYIQIITGIVIAFIHNLRRKEYVAAIFDQLTWLVMINSILLFGLGKAGTIPPGIGSIFGKAALVPAVAIVLFSEREGGWGGRLGMGAYQLFSTIFFLGDVLSYLRLMALGMVTAGLGMAINVIAGIVGEIPYGIGYVLGALVFVGGHAFNLVLSGLSAFVHTLRLQYVEFFPKFLTGSGKIFEPLAKDYKHVYIEQ